MPFKYVDESKAPPAPAKKSSGSAAYFANIVENLPEGKVAMITPEGDQTIRGIKVSVGRVASARKIKIQSWDDGSTVFVKRVAD